MQRPRRNCHHVGMLDPARALCRRLDIEGAGLSASEYLVSTSNQVALEERNFLDSALGPDIFAVTLDRLALGRGDSARLIVVRRSVGQ